MPKYSANAAPIIDMMILTQPPHILKHIAITTINTIIRSIIQNIITYLLTCKNIN